MHAMSDSELFASVSWYASTDCAALRVTLRDLQGFEGLTTRQFDLAVGAQLPIGRASKNSNKTELLPAVDNGYIDSPVISREHAQLSVRGDGAAPRVFITDLGSMHGTMVNGEQLVAHAPTPLSSGDMLQFGIDVNRNEGMLSPFHLPPLQLEAAANMPSPPEFFVARKYRFDAQQEPLQALFSLGFTVPDSEEEDVAGTLLRRGSQDNPLTLDDSDYAESDTSEAEYGGTTMGTGGSFIVDEDDDDDEPPAVDDIHLQSANDSWSGDYLADGVAQLVPENLIDTPLGSSDSEGEDAESKMDRVVSDVGDDSDIDGDSAVNDDLDDQDLADVEARMTSNTMPSQFAPSSVAPAPGLEVFPMEGEHRGPHFDGRLPAMNFFGIPPEASIPMNANPPPLPPRPHAPQPSLFGAPPPSRPLWYSDDVSPFPTFNGTNHGDRPVLFSPAPPFIAPAQDPTTALMHSGNPSSFAPAVGQTQTSLSTSSMDVATSSTPPPPPNRMLSIEEMVENQPPTPTSLNGLKRKADVLEETEETVVEIIMDASSRLSSPADGPVVNEAVFNNDAAQIAAIIAQRPKKQPRSLIKTGVKYLGIGLAGAAGTVALLSSLPDAFFV